METPPALIGTSIPVPDIPLNVGLDNPNNETVCCPSSQLLPLLDPVVGLTLL